MTTTAPPAWLDKAEYPFASHYLKTPAGRLHYIDEGQGEVILLVHGTPAWSFLYRHFIKDLSRDHRVIALDHLGFGLSDKPEGWTYRPEDHAKNLELLIDQLGLQNITLMVHDFGGPIGLSYAVGHPENVKQVVIMNTWMWSLNDRADLKKVDKMLKSWLGRFLYLNLNFSPKMLLKQAFADKKKLSRAIHSQYIKPFPRKSDRQGLYRIGLSLAASGAWFQSLFEKRSALQQRPVLVLWGTKDQFLKKDMLEQWKVILPAATFKELPEAGHFIQEEAPAEALEHIRTFLSKELK